MIKKIDDFFEITKRGSNFSKEILGGLAAFFAGVYILAVNPSMLSLAGMPYGGIFTATALSAAIATILMALLANVNVFLASGMGANAFFVFSVVLGMGISWQKALFAVLIEGIIFLLLTIFNARKYIVESIPLGIRKAIMPGIGCFVFLIGLANAGIVGSDTGTIIGFNNLNQGTALLATIGLVITIILYLRKIPGSIFIGMIATAIIGIPMGITKIPENFSFFSLPSSPLFMQFDATSFLTLDFAIVVFTLLFTDIFDTIGTLFGVIKTNGLVKEDGEIPKLKQMFLADSIGTIVGAIFGTSTVTSYVESGASSAQGARTGFSALITGILFLIALFFSPLFLLIPSAATTPALLIVGFLMFKGIRDLKFDEMDELIPAAITILFMSFSYSIALGIQYGILSYVVCKAALGKWKDIGVPTLILFVVFLAKFILS
jgi:AGZA family xanthine/uracil permease-like MFS transporter